MNDLQAKSEYIAFLDECGDHSLTKIDADFPIFVLLLLLVKRIDYCQIMLPKINSLKLKYWDHEGINLHSHDIRKAMGPFSILQNSNRKKSFIDDISKIMEELPYEIFVVGIDKTKLVEKYKIADNPYELAFTFIMERLVQCMEHRDLTGLPIIAESRGKNEDNSLKATFLDLVSKGTRYIDSGRFSKRAFVIQFHDKLKNIIGIQMADLCAYPSARHILKPEQNNLAFDIVKPHLFKCEGITYGWKIFP
jgi:hypothetical protein